MDNRVEVLKFWEPLLFQERVNSRREERVDGVDEVCRECCPLRVVDLVENRQELGFRLASSRVPYVPKLTCKRRTLPRVVGDVPRHMHSTMEDMDGGSKRLDDSTLLCKVTVTHERLDGRKEPCHE